MRVTVLGCGGSLGVPMGNGNWGTCDPENPRNRRSRPSIFIESNDTNILVDTSPDLRSQALSAGIKRIDAVVFTHAHADHTHGIDDVRPFFFHHDGPIPAYADNVTCKHLEEKFGYALDSVEMNRGLYRPILTLTQFDGPFVIDELRFDTFTQNHGPVDTIGFRLGNFGYSTDVATLPELAFDILAGVDTWIVDACREQPHPSHAHLARALEWIDRIKPRRAILTHMNHTMDYKTLIRQLPDGVEPGYDGMILDIPA